MLVDDSVVMRHVVRSMFDAHPKFVVCGEAEHGRDAVEKAPQLLPDLIVLDLTMPVMNGLVAAPLLFKILPDVWIILLSMHDYPDVHRASKAVGIHAVVSKTKASTHLIPQAEALVGGRAFSA